MHLAAGVIRCECQKRKIINAKLGAIPKRFSGSRFSNYIPVDGLQEVALQTISAQFTDSFFIHGEYARGKTHLATAQYRNLVEIERQCLLLSMSELIAELRRSEMDADYFCTVRHRVRTEDKFHLFVDDIDKFKLTEFKFEVLFDLFDTLYKRGLGLTVTSNYSLDELACSGQLHPAIVRRIDDICQVVKL